LEENEEKIKIEKKSYNKNKLVEIFLFFSTSFFKRRENIFYCKKFKKKCFFEQFFFQKLEEN